MVKYWIFVSLPFSDFNSSTISEMVMRRTVLNRWPIGKKTKNRSRVAPGDGVLFYQAGEGGKVIVASAEVSSFLKEDGSGQFLEIQDFRLWREPVDMKQVRGRLSFIKNKQNWGFYLQGGIVSIPEPDYLKIVRARKRHNVANALRS